MPRSCWRRWATAGHTCWAVVRQAQEIAAILPSEERAVLVAAAYLHDLGYAPALVETGFHALDGARHLRALGYERLAWPAFADTALADLDLMAVRSWLAGLEREAVSPNTVAKAYRLLARIMDTAVEAGLIVRNPCSVKGAATERAPEMRVATVAQVATLAETIDPASAPWS
jgi:hypothetical protein